MLLLTGSSGFIGSALKSRLRELSFDIVETCSENGGVTNPETFFPLLFQDVTHVFHLGGKTFVPESWEEQAAYFRTNVSGTQNVLELCRKTQAGLTFVSAYLYGQPDTLPVSESSPIRPNNPYAQSKHLAEQLCGFYAREYGVKVNIIRPFNVYGPGQDKRFLIPSIIEQALAAPTIKLKDLSPKRDYVYLDDLLDALVLTMSCTDSLSVYNIGSGYSISVRGVVDAVQEVLETDKPVVSEQITRRNEMDDVIADITRANTELNWYPKRSFHEGIRRIIQHEQRKIHAYA